LHLAAYFGHQAYCSFLISCGASLLARDKTGQTPLFKAVIASRENVLLTFLSQTHAPIDDVDLSQRTPLHWAADAGHASIMQMLLAREAEVDCEDLDGRTPLHLAALSGAEGRFIVFPSQIYT
jgi:ankyrin repeat protein